MHMLDNVVWGLYCITYLQAARGGAEYIDEAVLRTQVHSSCSGTPNTFMVKLAKGIGRELFSGAKAKFMGEATPMIVEAALSHLLEFELEHFLILLGCITYFHIFAHFLHAVYCRRRRISAISNTGSCSHSEPRIVTWCFGVELFYRCVTYCASELPDHPKKELEDFPYWRKRSISGISNAGSCSHSEPRIFYRCMTYCAFELPDPS